MPTPETTITVEQAELFRIKPLEWEWFEEPVCAGAPHLAQGYRTKQGHVYYARVYRSQIAEGGWSIWRWYSTVDYSNPCASPEEGKQLAEQHWQEYIKQALVPVEMSERKNA